MHYHFLNICGSAMGPLALDMVRRGYLITGSDTQWSPPVGPLLQASGIHLMDPGDIGAVAHQVDVWVVGTLAFCDPGVRAVVGKSRGRQVSFPMLVAAETGSARHRVVVTGTKGKTTTTSMLSHIFWKCGVAHDRLIGGITGDGRPSTAFHQSAIAVLEGDEYPEGQKNGGSKFFHYKPSHVGITSLAPDHEDRFSGFDAYCNAFHHLVRGIPRSGLCVLASDFIDRKADVTSEAVCRVISVGGDPRNEVQIRDVRPGQGCIHFKLGGHSFTVPGFQLANAQNACVAAVLAQDLGIPTGDAALALQDFEPPADRLHLRASAGGKKVFVESCAHPIALLASMRSLGEHFKECPVTVVVQPQFPGAEAGSVQRDLPQALAAAKRVIIAPPVTGGDTGPEKPFLPERVVDDLAALGVPASYETTRSRIVQAATGGLAENHILLLAIHNPSRELLTSEIISALQLIEHTTPTLTP